MASGSRLTRAVLAAVALLLAAVPAMGAASRDGPRYQLVLDVRQPLMGQFALHLPPSDSESTELRLRPGSDGSFASPPACADGRIEALGGGRWRADAKCREIRWTVALTDHEREGVDAAYPVGAWDRAGRWWIVTSRLGLLTVDEGPSAAPLEVLVRDARARVFTHLFTLRGPEHIPLYAIVSPAEPIRIEADGFALDVYGAVPEAVARERLAALTATWAAWRRDVLPAGVDAPRRLALALVHPPVGTGPGYVASAGSDAILMHYVEEPGVVDPQAKLRIGVTLVGGHEGFHALIGTWPTWVNESWATYFAYRAILEAGDAEALAVADGLVQQPVEPGLLAVQAEVDGGNSANYNAFYSKGARFWQAVDAVLTTRDSPSGRLAALIQDSNVFADVDWSDPASLAAFLDARSDGRAGALVRCYLTESGCPSAS